VMHTDSSESMKSTAYAVSTATRPSRTSRTSRTSRERSECWPEVCCHRHSTKPGIDHASMADLA
jgi:hypothetical protein